MREFYKRIYSTKEFYFLLDDALKSMKDYKKAIKTNLIDKVFQEKIILAVTEVNGCEICNILHTNSAIKLNISKIEIDALSSGLFKIGTSIENEAIEFAKHYASNNGNYDKSKWDSLVKNNDLDTAKGILGVIRIIMMGNAYGIAYGALKRRFKLKPVKASTFLNELGVLFSVIIFIPFILIKKIIKK